MVFYVGNRNPSISRYIAVRYISSGKRSHLVSFMSAVSILGLTLGVAILITVLSVMNGFDKEMRESILGVVPHITISSGENLSANSWQEIADKAVQVPGVVAVAPVVQEGGIVLTNNASRSVLVTGVDTQVEGEVSIIDQFFIAGSLESLSKNRWGMIVGKTLADQLGVKLGGFIDLYSSAVSINPLTPLASYRKFEVVGIFKVGNQDLDNELVITNIGAARALFRSRSPFTGLRIKTFDVLKADEIMSSLTQVLPVSVRTMSWSNQFGAIYENIKFSRSIISFMLWLLVGVAAFNLVVSLTMIVRDKKRDIAILRTLGATPKLIQKIFIWQGVLIGLAGITSGLLLGIIGSLQITHIVTMLEWIFSTRFLDAEIYPIDFLPSQLSLTDILYVIFGVVVLSLLVTIYPARRAAAIQPAEVLRAD